MFDGVTQQRSRWRIFWPEVDDLDGANEAIKLGYGACFVLAGLAAVMAVIGSKAAFVDAILYVGLGLLLRRKSRTAALIAVVLMTLSIIMSVSQFPIVGALTIILYVCLISAVRGTFAYRRLVRAGSGSVAELVGKVPPPVLGTPLANTASEPSPSIVAVEAVARNYRNLVLLVGLQILLAVLLQVVTEPVVALVLLAVLFTVAIAMVVFVYKLMSGLDAGSPILWALASLVPLVNLLVLAAISSKAQTWCKRHGIKVGLLGPTASSLAEFRLRVQSYRMEADHRPNIG